jgi:guanyl-specific ribonuclease Sa
MKKVILLPAMFMTLLLASCHHKHVESTATSNAGTSTNNTNSDEIRDVKIIPASEVCLTGDPYTIDSLTINGDVLSVFINYSGGCNPHQFDLTTNGNYEKSLPPQLSLCLNHSSNGDKCRKLIMRELKFNIESLKRQGTQTLVLKIGEKEVNYLNK